MACPDDNTLSRVLDGTLPLSERAALEAHADGCEACAATLVHLARSFLTTAPASTDAPISSSARLPDGAARYRLGPPIGSGGMGTVHTAFDRVLGRSVAVKLLRADAVGAGVGRAQLLQEARAMARVTDPHVVSVYDAGEGPDGVYLAMELVRGPTLRGWLTGHPRSFDEVLARFVEAGRGLVAAHEAGIVHRDFKPENVLVGADGRARVTDFGLARPGQDGDAPVSVPASMTGLSVGRFAGTPAYMAPEQLDGADVTAKTDQYAFCVALHEAAYGVRPFAEPTWEGTRSAMRRGPVRPQERDVPTWLWPLLARGLSERPEDRHPSMRELVASLEHDGKRGAEWHLAVHVAALCTLACAYLGISVLVIVGVATAGDAPEEPPEPWYVQAFAGWLAVLIGTGWAPVSVVWAPVTALGIHRRRGWAYPLLAIYAALSLLSGIGTPYAVYALWSLRLPAVRRALGRRDDPAARLPPIAGKRTPAYVFVRQRRTADVLHSMKRRSYQPPAAFGGPGGIHTFLALLLLLLTFTPAVYAAKPPAAPAAPTDPHAAAEHAAPAEAADADVAAHADRTPVKMKVGIRLTGLSKLELGPGSYNAELVVTVHCEREPCKPEIETPNGKITGREVVHAEKLLKVFKIKAELTGFVDLSEFPYDKHVLPIVLEDKGDPEDVVYELDAAHTSIQDDVKLPGWTLVKWAADVEKDDLGEGITVSQIHFGVLVERPGLSATFKTIVPVAFMIFVAGFTLLLKPKSAAGRLSAATGGLMTIVMFHISATSSLPPLTYLTRMDKFMLATYVVYLLNIALAVAIVRADEQKDEKRAERLYLTAAGAIPGLALVAWLGVFLKLV